MTKAKSRASRNITPSTPHEARHSAAHRTKKRASRASARSRAAASAQKPGTKQAQVVAMLRSPGGTTITAIMKKTGWQQHSVRGYLAGVVRKRLKLDLVSDKTDKGRIYRIRDKRAGPDQGGAAKPAV